LGTDLPLDEQNSTVVGEVTPDASHLRMDLSNALVLSLAGLLVTGASNALNQVLEVDADSLMKRTAERLGHRGWLDHPDELAVERLLLIDDALLSVVVERELGPLLADLRMGEELVETLVVYFDAGENMREAARRLHLANRTVAYRLERIESLLGGPLDGARRERLVVALLARRVLERTTRP
jgi:DNA-binding PucR family transcriptional regulator